MKSTEIIILDIECDYQGRASKGIALSVSFWSSRATNGGPQWQAYNKRPIMIASNTQAPVSIGIQRGLRGSV